MSESYGVGTSGASGTGPQQPSGTIETAKQEAAGVKDTAAEEAGHVASTAKSEAGAVAREAKSQLKDLFHQTRTQLSDQAGTQQRRVADGLRSVGGELSSMADNSDSQGIAADVVRQVSTRVDGIAGWIGDREPADLLNEVKSFARRKPGIFIAGAAVAGLVVGRLTRALAQSAAENKSDSSGSAQTAGRVPVAGSTAGPVSGVTPSPDAWAAPGAGVGAGAGIPPAPDGVDGAAARGGALPGQSAGTPVYDQTDAASRDPFGEGRP